MSTRSIIVVTGHGGFEKPSTVRLYKHSDGYPTSVLWLLVEALRKARKQCRIANQKYGETRFKPTVTQVVGLLIGAGSDEYGMGVRIDTEDDSRSAIYSELLKAHHFGNQGDLEWIYEIDLSSNTLRIYGGGFTGDLPQLVVEHGTVDPLSYSSQLKTENRTDETAAIRRHLKSLHLLGIRVNPQSGDIKSERKSA